MNARMITRLMTVLFVLGVADGLCEAVAPAFPGAEGYGMYSIGGRGGVVYEVTNLNDNGTGSFREACAASGARTVVFRVSGTIQALSRISILNPYITIAGQTAPGDGICIRDAELMVRTHDVIVRNIRFRRGNTSATGGDSLDVMYSSDKVVIDHCSASWGEDESLSCYGNTNITIQWCMIGEGLYDHSCGGLWGPNSSYHHNLFYSNGTRNPKLAYGSAGNVWDFRNNMVYNWGYESSNGDVVGNLNMVNNYYEYGPGTLSGSLRYKITSGGGWNVYAAGNYVWGYPDITADNWSGGIQGTYVRSYTPFTAPDITMQTAEVAHNYVLAAAGAISPRRDPVDVRVINQIQTRTYTFAGLKNGTLYPGIPDSMAMVGGWPTLNATAAPVDTDHDGMPDSWETAKGLNPNNAADRNSYTLDASYTNLEVYLNSLCPDPYAPTPNPAIFANAPYAVSTTSIAMSAAPASDPYGVEYYFTCTSGGGHDSGWQTANSYTDTGLAPMTTYSYTVKVRSTNPDHTTIQSAIASASTNTPPDNEAPTPSPMAWSVMPHAQGIDTVVMTAVTAADRSGVQYLFANLTDPNHNSGWQESVSYTDTGLTNNTDYVYRVKARDNSPFLNETGWSADANAMTLRYACSSLPEGDLNGDCQVDFLDFARFASQWGVIPTVGDLVSNGTFEADVSNWQFLPPAVTDGPVTASFDAANGNPAGSAKLAADTTTAATNSSRFYQVIPVTAGRNYRVSGDWMGDIKGTVGTVTSARNWAEIYVTFVDDGSVVPASWGSIMYKKAFGVANMNVGAAGTWAWEPITSSATGASGPADGVFTATDDYMIVAVNLGGRANSGQTYFNVDNFQVVETNPCPRIDLNNDCILDFLDIQQFASYYLSCGRTPATECWE
jgi:pectate lyase